MYYVNKIAGAMMSPMGFTMALVAVAIVAWVLGRRRLACGAVVFALANVWIWSTPLMSRFVSIPLEREFLKDGRAPSAESFPTADFIVLHGGGMGVATNLGYAAEMWTSADRVWQAARLWKLGKAPKIVCTGTGCRVANRDLLLDFGVPENAMVFLENARNTEEEAKAIVAMGSAARALVVTSAWHMKRTLLLYRKFAPGVEAIPAPCDFEATVNSQKGFRLGELLPGGPYLMGNEYCFHEWIGYLGYKFLR